MSHRLSYEVSSQPGREQLKVDLWWFHWPQSSAAFKFHKRDRTLRWSSLRLLLWKALLSRFTVLQLLVSHPGFIVTFLIFICLYKPKHLHVSCRCNCLSAYVSDYCLSACLSVCMSAGLSEWASRQTGRETQTDGVMWFYLHSCLRFCSRTIDKGNTEESPQHVQQQGIVGTINSGTRQQSTDGE